MAKALVNPILIKIIKKINNSKKKNCLKLQKISN
jgi:hypothetical protein